MVNEMPSRWFAAALSVWGLLAAIGPVRTVGQDRTMKWLSEHLSPGWRFMELTSVGFNPDKPEYGSAPDTEHVSEGRFPIVDPNGLIGLSPVAVNVSAFDEGGKSISVEDKLLWTPCSMRAAAIQTTRLSGSPQARLASKSNLTISRSICTWTTRPRSRRRSAGSNGRWTRSWSHSFGTVDLPFAPSEAGVEVAPGLEILISKATAKSESYSYSAQAKYDRKEIGLPVSLTGSSLQPPLVARPESAGRHRDGYRRPGCPGQLALAGP